MVVEARSRRWTEEANPPLFFLLSNATPLCQKKKKEMTRKESHPRYAESGGCHPWPNQRGGPAGTLLTLKGPVRISQFAGPTLLFSLNPPGNGDQGHSLE